MSIKDSTSGSSIYYTTDGSVPSTSSSLYSSPLFITATTTIQAIAVVGDLESSMAASTLTITPLTGGSTGPTPIPASFMGLNVGDTVNRNPSFPFGTLMTNGRVGWLNTNPSPGVFDFSILDQYFAYAQAHNADIIFPLGGTPTWASAQPNQASIGPPGSCAPPADMSDWDAYVSAVGTYAGSNIKYWSVGNEVQNPGYWCGDMSTMLTMVQHARTILQQINPNAIMLSPSTVSLPDGPAWLASFLAAGGGQYVDVIAFHGYDDAVAEDLLTVLSTYKNVMTAAKSTLPLWDIEADWAGNGNLPQLSSPDQVAFLSKYFLLHWAQGISRFVWYEYDGGDPWGGLVCSETSMIGCPVLNYAETPAAVSYAQTYKWLVGAEMAEKCYADTSSTYRCSLSRHNGYLAQVLWNSTTTLAVDVPTGFTLYRDLAGDEQAISGGTVTVGNQPILIENGPLP